MPILRIIGTAATPAIHGDDRPVAAALDNALRSDPGPVTVMIHGFKFRPDHTKHCPFDSILSPTPRRTGPRLVSWPRRLGLRGGPGEGVGLAFGWNARGTIWGAHRRAAHAGDRLAQLLMAVRALDPDRPVRLIGHSLGARVALRAMARLPRGSVDRAIVMAAAEYEGAAAIALDAQGPECGLLNVTSRENDLFDFLVETVIPRRGDRVMGAATLRAPGLVHLQIDHAVALVALRDAGFPVAPPMRRVCHWSAYLRPGLFPLYRAFLDGRIAPQSLRAALPDQSEPRWIRLRSPLPAPGAGPLPG